MLHPRRVGPYWSESAGNSSCWVLLGSKLDGSLCRHCPQSPASCTDSAGDFWRPIYLADSPAAPRESAIYPLFLLLWLLSAWWSFLLKTPAPSPSTPSSACSGVQSTSAHACVRWSGAGTSCSPRSPGADPSLQGAPWWSWAPRTPSPASSHSGRHWRCHCGSSQPTPSPVGSGQMVRSRYRLRQLKW